MSLGPGAGGYTPASTRRRRGSPMLRLLFLIVIIGAGSWVYWITRDTVPPHALVPSDAPLTITISDPMGVKEAFASSSIWEASAIFDTRAADVQRALAEPIPLPPWVLNHVLGHKLYGYTFDSIDPTHCVMLSKMTRVGVLLERGAIQFSDAITSDWAGGLKLRHVPEANLYYAVRGRMLVASGDRASLVRALTLRSTDTIGGAQYDANVAGANKGGIYFRIAEDDTIPWARDLDTVVRIDGKTVEAVSRGRMSAEWAHRLAPLMDRSKPLPLSHFDGDALSIALNVGKGAEEVVEGFSRAYDPESDNSYWAEWARPTSSDEPWSFGHFLAEILRDCEGELSLGWSDVNPDEIMPIPLVRLWAEGTLDVGRFNPVSDEPHAAVPQASEGGDSVTLPMPGGASFQPRAHLSDGGVLITNVGDGVPSTRTRGEPGNLRIEIDPTRVATLVQQLGQPWADQGLLAGHTRGSFDALMDEWRDRAEPFESVLLHASIEAEMIVLRTRVHLR